MILTLMLKKFNLVIGGLFMIEVKVVQENMIQKRILKGLIVGWNFIFSMLKFPMMVS